jgi:glycosyltransferase involved in cell wall biosynthesis
MSSPFSDPLSIIVLTYNEAKNLPDLLHSLEGLNAPIFVVDSYSTDATLDVLAAAAIRYVQHPFENYAAQRNWAQANNPFYTEWVLHLDAGERATPELIDWLKHSFDANTSDTDGYLVARRAIFLGKWMRYGGYHPIYHLRLFRVAKGYCEHKAYDQHFVSSGHVTTAPIGVDISDTVMADLRSFTVQHARWAVFEAVDSLQQQQDSGEVQAKLLGNPVERRRWWKTHIFQRTPLFVRSIAYFFYRYFFKLGFLDGKEGLVFHVLQGFWFRFLVDSITLEIQKELPNKSLQTIVQDNYQLDAKAIINS